MNSEKFLKIIGSAGILAFTVFVSFEVKDKVKEATSNEVIGGAAFGAIQFAGHATAAYILKDLLNSKQQFNKT